MKSDPSAQEASQPDSPPRAPVDIDPEHTVDRAASHSGSTWSSDAITDGNRREVVIGNRPLADETRDLVQGRLRAATFLFVTAFLAYLIRNVFIARPIILNIGHLVVLGTLAAVLAALFRRVYSIRRLRQMEWLVFGLPVLFFGFNQFVLIREHAVMENHVAEHQLSILATVKSTVIYCFATMVTYGTFIPNTWQRALRMVAPVAVTPVVVSILLRLTYSNVGTIVENVATPSLVSDNLLMLGLGLASAVYATHVINSLRVEAFAARQLAQYRLTKLIGRGAMGEVYLAHHELLKRPCAVKLIRPDKAGDARVLARFAREVKQAARLSHWNSIDIFDYGVTEDGTFFYVMEFLPGLSLQQMVQTYGPLPPGRSVYLVRQVCEAMAEAEASGLVHRDIKPSNIFAAYRGGRYDVAKLLDFGLVKPLDSGDGQLSFEGDITGSPYYMSPEQASGHPPDIRSDIYSLGAVLYFLLSGRPPFEGDNVLQIMMAHVRDPLVTLSERGIEVDRDLEQIVIRCLEKQPGERFSSSSEMARALHQCRAAQDWDRQQAEQWWLSRNLDLASRPTRCAQPESPQEST